MEILSSIFAAMLVGLITRLITPKLATVIAKRQIRRAAADFGKGEPAKFPAAIRGNESPFPRRWAAVRAGYMIIDNTHVCWRRALSKKIIVTLALYDIRIAGRRPAKSSEQTWVGSSSVVVEAEHRGTHFEIALLPEALTLLLKAIEGEPDVS